MNASITGRFAAVTFLSITTAGCSLKIVDLRHDDLDRRVCFLHQQSFEFVSDQRIAVAEFESGACLARRTGVEITFLQIARSVCSARVLSCSLDSVSDFFNSDP